MRHFGVFDTESVIDSIKGCVEDVLDNYLKENFDL